MKVEQYIRIMAGTFVMASVALAFFHSNWWLVFTFFVGANLFQSALTGICPAEAILCKLGVKR